VTDETYANESRQAGGAKAGTRLRFDAS